MHKKMQKIKNEKFSNSVWHYIRLYLECIQDSVKKFGACRFKMHDSRVFMEISFQINVHNMIFVFEWKAKLIRTPFCTITSVRRNNAF